MLFDLSGGVLPNCPYGQTATGEWPSLRPSKCNLLLHKSIRQSSKEAGPVYNILSAETISEDYFIPVKVKDEKKITYYFHTVLDKYV